MSQTAGTTFHAVNMVRQLEKQGGNIGNGGDVADDDGSS